MLCNLGPDCPRHTKNVGLMSVKKKDGRKHQTFGSLPDVSCRTTTEEYFAINVDNSYELTKSPLRWSRLLLWITRLFVADGLLLWITSPLIVNHQYQYLSLFGSQLEWMKYTIIEIIIDILHIEIIIDILHKIWHRCITWLNQVNTKFHASQGSQRPLDFLQEFFIFFTGAQLEIYRIYRRNFATLTCKWWMFCIQLRTRIPGLIQNSAYNRFFLLLVILQQHIYSAIQVTQRQFGIKDTDYDSS